jgi:hypothetical protein
MVSKRARAFQILIALAEAFIETHPLFRLLESIGNLWPKVQGITDLLEQASYPFLSYIHLQMSNCISQLRICE